MAFVLTVIASGADGVLPVRLGSFVKKNPGDGGLAGEKTFLTQLACFAKLAEEELACQ
jgi:hypothetical protein